ncbi:hypothetical protein [Pyrobaculum aerophilum]|uniref:hypothetical protein n=1 Tax=Pyrobaculum aerophilum TaxID=13773 RepID=UPI0023F26AE9|nr:hypothetical protein [Pyrobaculum aerophilum]MCX8136637.1 hypothetical protein [Pyrobaculum aerophilum]
MLLIIVKTDSPEVSKRLGRMVEGLELVPGVYLTWYPKDKAARAVEAVKKNVVKQWEERGKGPVFEAALLELSEEQYKEVRPMARAVIEAVGAAMLEEMERLLVKMRSGKQGKNLLGWYRDLANRYQKLVNAALALDIEPTIIGKLKDKWKEVSLEAGRLRS